MKRLFLILAICLIIALSAIWGYLLFFGAPESTREFFANFNFGNTEETTLILGEEVPVFENTEDNFGIAELDALRQLTTKPVAGYVEVIDQISSSTFVYYIEIGTGHIFKLDAETGIEERLSNVTIPNAQHGYIHHEGKVAVIQSEAPGSGELTIVELTGAVDTADSFPLISAAYDFTLTENREVLYTLKTSTNLEGYSYNIETKVTTKIFTLPFREAVVLWGESANSDHFTYPKAEPRLEGYLYKISGNGLTREPLSGFGFTAKSGELLILASKFESNENISTLYDLKSNTFIDLNYAIVPEKCSFIPQRAAAVCAVPSDLFTQINLSEWYKGTEQLTDTLLMINFFNESVQTALIMNLQEVSGRNIDAINLTIEPTENRLYFQNNVDQTLWLFEQTQN